MDVKEYLRQLEKIKVEIEELKEEETRLKLDMYTLGSPLLEEKVQHFGECDKMAQFAIKVEQMETEIANKILELMETRIKILNQIHQLNNADQIKILYKRYVEMKEWRAIAEECEYTERQIHNIHGKALKAFEKISVNFSSKSDNM